MGRIGAKGNDGRAARRKLQKKLILAVTCVVTCVVTVWVVGGRGASNSSTEDALQLKARHLRPRGGGGLRSKQQQEEEPRQQDDNADPLDRILSGELHLIEIHVNQKELGNDDDNSYSGGVYGTFCRLDWSLHKHDPSSYPMFRDLVAHSPGCASDQRFSNIDVRAVAAQARALDTAGDGGAASVLKLTAAVFHESRCGSTLTANLLASYDPVRHRVYSESGPPLQALKSVCGEAYEHCHASKAAAVLRDVVYLMSRSDDAREERVFFKIQSAGTRNLDVFQTAFPETPYLFVYRDPVQVMMSHLGKGSKRNANCVRQQRSGPPAAVERIVRRHNSKSSARKLITEDYCAAHLASLTETVVQQHSDKQAIPVNYERLPEALYEDILPWLGLHVSDVHLKRMKLVATAYSKGRDGQAGAFVEDSAAKEQAASDAVKQAAATYLQESYEELEKMAAAQMKLMDQRAAARDEESREQ